MEQITFFKNPAAAPSPLDARFGMHTAERALRFARSLPEYSPTPLRRLDRLAAELHLGALHVKDESPRFGLNSFKALGGSYAVACALGERLGLEGGVPTFACLTSDEVQRQLDGVALVTATDGNHGRGIAWTARQLGLPCTVYMPRGTAPARIEHIRRLGADVLVTDCTYDDTARMARRAAERSGWLLAQDTTFPGYEEFPRRCMEGYTGMAHEAMLQHECSCGRPTHVFIQCGAGSLAGAVAAYFSSVYGADRPVLSVIEAQNCACMKATAEAGAPRICTGGLETIMAGLSVGEPCTVAWDALRTAADFFFECPDDVTELGMKLLANPTPLDPAIVSGESGAVGVGLVTALMTDAELADMRQALGLGPDSRVLCFSTEGDTDHDSWRRIVTSPFLAPDPPEETDDAG